MNDSREIAELYNAYAEDAYKLGRRLKNTGGISDQDKEDAVSDALHASLRNYDAARYPGRQGFLRYFYTVLSHQLSRQRARISRSREKTISSFWSYDEDPENAVRTYMSNPDTVDRILDPSDDSNPATDLVARERGHISTSGLSPEDKKLISLYADGASLKEIGKALGYSDSMALSRLKRVLPHLKRTMYANEGKKCEYALGG